MGQFNLTPDQKTAVEIAFQRMAAEGWLTDEQAHIVIRCLLDLPPWTDEDESREQAWLDSIAPTSEEREAIHARAAKRGARHAAA